MYISSQIYQSSSCHWLFFSWHHLAHFAILYHNFLNIWLMAIVSAFVDLCRVATRVPFANYLWFFHFANTLSISCNDSLSRQRSSIFVISTLISISAEEIESSILSRYWTSASLRSIFHSFVRCFPIKSVISRSHRCLRWLNSTVFPIIKNEM